MREGGPFAGQSALVTGATSGIGRAIVGVLADRGAAVWAVGRRGEELRALEGLYPSVRGLEGDLTDDARIQVVSETIRQQGELDLLVHAAAVAKLGSLHEATVGDLDLQYRINVRAPYLLTQALLPFLSARAQIVFLNSSAGLAARAKVGQYAATKHALKAIADSLREELHPSGRRVLAVFAGRTATPMQREILAWEGRPYDPSRLIDPVELAGIIADALQVQSAEIKEINVRPRFE